MGIPPATDPGMARAGNTNVRPVRFADALGRGKLVMGNPVRDSGAGDCRDREYPVDEETVREKVFFIIFE
jgi:hypothetical protein